MDSNYKITLQVDMRPPIEWPSWIPAPVVGDEVTGQFGEQAFAAKVIRRAWGLASEAETGKLEAVLVVTAETPQPAKPGRASVHQLRI
jgi:hypothetical protein